MAVSVDFLTNASGWWSRYPFNATNLSPTCDIVGDHGYEFGGLGSEAGEI